MGGQTNDWREFRPISGRDAASWTFGFEARALSAVLPFKAERDRCERFTLSDPVTAVTRAAPPAGGRVQLPEPRKLEFRLKGSESAIKRCFSSEINWSSATDRVVVAVGRADNPR
ncbi:hypothetical protein SRHO_G00175800 [Serrasalmus rhombeus]